MASTNEETVSSESLAEKLEAIAQIQDDEERACALIELAAQLPPSRSEILQQALESVQPNAFKEFYNSGLLQQFTQVLAILVPQLPDSQRSEFLQQALNAVRLNENQTIKVEALTALASLLPDSQRLGLREAKLL